MGTPQSTGLVAESSSTSHTSRSRNIRIVFGVMDKERFRSASPVDRSLCSLELGERADALGEGRRYVKMAVLGEVKCFGKVFDNYELRIMNYENLLAKNRLSECEIRINKINIVYEQKR